MNKIALILMMFIFSLVFASEYSVYNLNGKVLGNLKCDKATDCAQNANLKYKQAVLLVSQKKNGTQTNWLSLKVDSQDTIHFSMDENINWVEMEKNGIESICVEDSSIGTWFVSDLSYRLQSDNCLQIQAGGLTRFASVRYMRKNDAFFKFNILIGEKKIDLTNKEHLLGYFGDEYKLNRRVVYSDPQKDFNNRIYPDPERKESINEVLIVDKYPVTNCDFIQVLWDSIPRVSMSKNENMTRYHNHWIERKEKMIKNERCDTHDSAAIKIYLYDALIYANARSVRDGFEPVYKFERIRQKNYIPSLYENGDFDVFTMSFFEKYEDSDANWLRVKVDKSANGYRLPYYDEWMALARGGTANRRYIWGENEDPAIASQYAWFGAGKVISEKYGVYQQDSRPVGMLKPNAYGLYDMLGLVCENVMLPGKSIFANEITSCKGGFLYDSLEKLNFGAHEDNWNAGYGGYQGLRLVRQIK